MAPLQMQTSCGTGCSVSVPGSINCNKWQTTRNGNIFCKIDQFHLSDRFIIIYTRSEILALLVGSIVWYDCPKEKKRKEKERKQMSSKTWLPRLHKILKLLIMSEFDTALLFDLVSSGSWHSLQAISESKASSNPDSGALYLWPKGRGRGDQFGPHSLCKSSHWSESSHLKYSLAWQ